MTIKPHKSPWTAEYKNTMRKHGFATPVMPKYELQTATHHLKGHVKNRQKLKFDEIMKLVAVTEVEKKQVSLLFN